MTRLASRLRPAILLLASSLFAADPATPVTAQQIVDRIKDHVGIPWMEQTNDTFKAGDPATPVKGVALVMMSTLDVLKKAVAADCNFVITHEPTFFNGQDNFTLLTAEKDAVLAAKLAYIKEHNLVIWRFHDHQHRMKRDQVVTGVAKALGWAHYQSADNERVFTLPETTLGQLAVQMKKQLGIRTLRVVGDPQMKVRGAALSPGFSGYDNNRRLLQHEKVQVLVLGEAHEWETIEYGADAVAAGLGKALIVLGHIPSEEAGMQECAEWLKAFVPEVPLKFVATPEPFWSPDEK